MPYEPALFLDARTSVGTAPSADGRYLRMVLRRADGTVRRIRRLPLRDDPAVEAVAAAGDTLVWAENIGDHHRLWTVGLRDGRAPRQITADTGDARFYQSQFDLSIAAGKVRWVAAGEGDTTEIRSVALAGGPAEIRVEQGTWELTSWPWMSDGVVSAAGTTRLKNAVTGRIRNVPAKPEEVATCSSTWCRVTSLAEDGSLDISLMHPDGTSRRDIAGGTVRTSIADVAVLDRFEVFGRLNPTTDLTGNSRLLVYEIATRRIVEISPDAGNVSCRGGVLWWSTGTQETFLRHTLDLRTV